MESAFLPVTPMSRTGDAGASTTATAQDQILALKKALGVVVAEAVSRAKELKLLQEQQTALKSQLIEAQASKGGVISSSPLETPVSPTKLFIEGTFAAVGPQYSGSNERNISIACVQQELGHSSPNSATVGFAKDALHNRPRGSPHAAGVSAQAVSQKLRVRLVQGVPFACLDPSDPVAITIMRGTIPGSPVSGVNGDGGALAFSSCGMRRTQDGVVLCPAQIYLDVARGRSMESVLEAQTQLPIPQPSTERMPGFGTTAQDEALPREGVAHVVAESGGFRVPSPSIGVRRRLSAVAAAAGKNVAPEENAKEWNVSAGGRRVGSASVKSSSSVSGAQNVAPLVIDDGMLDNPLRAKMSVVNALAGKGMGSTLPTAQAAPVQRKRQKPLLPHQTRVMDAGAPSAHGVGEKLRKSLGSSYRSMGVMELNMEARIERRIRDNNGDLLSQDGSDEGYPVSPSGEAGITRDLNKNESSSSPPKRTARRRVQVIEQDKPSWQRPGARKKVHMAVEIQRDTGRKETVREAQVNHRRAPKEDLSSNRVPWRAAPAYPVDNMDKDEAEASPKRGRSSYRITHDNVVSAHRAIYPERRLEASVRGRLQVSSASRSPLRSTQAGDGFISRNVVTGSSARLGEAVDGIDAQAAEVSRLASRLMALSVDTDPELAAVKTSYRFPSLVAAMGPTSGSAPIAAHPSDAPVRGSHHAYEDSSAAMSAEEVLEDGDAALRAALAKVRGSQDVRAADAVAAAKALA